MWSELQVRILHSAIKPGNRKATDRAAQSGVPAVVVDGALVTLPTKDIGGTGALARGVVTQHVAARTGTRCNGQGM